MSLLSRTAPSETGPAPAGSRPLHSPLAVGALAAVQSVVGSLLTVIGPVVGIWIASTRTGATWSEAARLAADAWLLAHHTGIAVTGGHVALIPLGLSLVPAAWCWTAGRRMAIVLGLSAGTAAPGRSGRRALVAYASVYALLAALVSLLAASPVARPISGQALLGAGALAFLVTGASMLRTARTPSRPDPWGVLADRLRIPGPVRRVLPAAGVALGTWLAASALALALALVLGWDGVMAAHQALDPGAVGWLGLVALQLALLPVAVIWTAAWLAGPGFAVGTGTSVTVWGTELGAVPALPLLAGVPGDDLAGGVAMLAVPVLAGAMGGLWLARREPEEGVTWWRRALAEAATCGLVAGAGAGLLAWLASGPAGPGRLAVVGPQAWQVALVVSAEVAVGCVLVLLALGATGTKARLPQSRLPSRAGNWLRSRIQRS